LGRSGHDLFHGAVPGPRGIRMTRKPHIFEWGISQ